MMAEPQGEAAVHAAVPQPYALMRWFALAGALSIGLFSLGMAWVLSSFLGTSMLQRDAAVSRDFVQSIANIQQVAGFFRAPDVQPAPSVVEFFAHVAAMPDVLRANVYSPQRRVMWSSRAELIGQTFAANLELDQALAGHVVVNLEDEAHDAAPGKAEHQGLQSPALGYVENYLPVYDEKRGPGAVSRANAANAANGPNGAPASPRELIAVIELYRQPTALLSEIERGKRLIRIGSALGGVFLFSMLMWFVRRTERALQLQQQRVVEAETMAAVGEISAAVAHSIRNPLGSIRSSAELQAEMHGDAAGVQAEIVRNVDRVEHLVRTLLSYAAGPAQRPNELAISTQSADLAWVLREAVERFGPELKAQGKHFECTAQPGVGTIAADPVVLAQVLNSLLANAAEATRAGDHIRLSAAPAGSGVCIEVSDTGGGIAPEHMQRIFKPFFTTKARGLGMGLPLARRIVERLGGTLAIGPGAERGTVVSLVLPRVLH
jgi:two-component system, NtrC family, sensor histidine kinase HydH